VVVGKESDAQTVTVPTLEKVPEEPEPAAPPSRPEAKPDEPKEEATGAEEPDHTLAYVIGGAGVVLTGVGTVFGVLAMSAYDEADTACPSHTGCSASAMDSRDTAGVRANIANVGVGLGLVGIGVGAVLLLTSGGSDETPARDQAGLAVAPQLGPGVAGAALSGRF